MVDDLAPASRRGALGRHFPRGDATARPLALAERLWVGQAPARIKPIRCCGSRRSRPRRTKRAKVASMRPDMAEVGAEAAGRTLGFDRLEGSLAQRANDFAVSGLRECLHGLRAHEAEAPELAKRSEPSRRRPPPQRTPTAHARRGGSRGRGSPFSGSTDALSRRRYLAGRSAAAAA